MVSSQHPSFEEALRCARLWVDRPLSDEEWEQANRTQALPAIRPDIELLARAVVGLFEQLEAERKMWRKALDSALQYVPLKDHDFIEAIVSNPASVPNSTRTPQDDPDVEYDPATGWRRGDIDPASEAEATP